MKRQIDPTHIHSKFKCIRSNNTQELIAKQSLLDFATFGTGIPSSIGFDLTHEMRCRWVRFQGGKCPFKDPFDQIPRLGKRHAPNALTDSTSQQQRPSGAITKACARRSSSALTQASSILLCKPTPIRRTSLSRATRSPVSSAYQICSNSRSGPLCSR